MMPPIARVAGGHTVGAAWATFGTVALSLVAALGGGIVGSGGRRREPAARAGAMVETPV
jgi:hypothetical protein